jgi:hypothetical protein
VHTGERPEREELGGRLGGVRFEEPPARAIGGHVLAHPIRELTIERGLAGEELVRIALQIGDQLPARVHGVQP